MHPFVRVFVAGWFTFLALIAGGSVLILAFGSATDATTKTQGGGWEILWILLGLMAFGSALVMFGRYLAQEEGDYLEDFLVQTLDAEP